MDDMKEVKDGIDWGFLGGCFFQMLVLACLFTFLGKVIVWLFDMGP
jgi:hypothetical protein